MYRSLRVRVKRGLVLGRLPHLYEFSLEEPYWVLTVKIGGEKPLMLQQREGKIAILKYTQSILFFLTRLALKRNYFTGTLPTGVLPAPGKPGRREIANSSAL